MESPALLAALPYWQPQLELLAATFVLAGIDAGEQAYQIKRGHDVSHLWNTRERLVGLAGFTLLAYDNQLSAQLVALLQPGNEAWRLAPLLAPLVGFLAACALTGLRFDIRLNLRRSLDRYYLGTDPQTAATDKAVRGLRLSGRQFAYAKLATTIAGSALAAWLSRP